jgi:predicted tellurium resistance membrane protein TerC
MEWLADPNAWIGLLTLTLLEVVLGIDNIIFISILASKLPKEQQYAARQTGILLALGTRILLLFSISWLVGLSQPLFALFGYEFSGRDLVLIGGGLFLIAKATWEIHGQLEGAEEGAPGAKLPTSFASVVAQIILIDVIFSLDSVITAVGMVDELAVMVTAVVISIGFMLFAAGPVSAFIEKHPTVKMLALAFLVLIGVNLLAEGFGTEIEKGYTYFALAFSLGVEVLNLRTRKKPEEPVHLRKSIR